MILPFRRRNRRGNGASRPSAFGKFAGLEALEGRSLLTILGQQIFPSDNPWNQPVASAPVAANSSAIINNIITKNGSDGRLHPDFSQNTGGSAPLYGISYNVVHGNAQAKVHVTVDTYPGESDLQDVPIPANAVVEGDMQNGPTAGLVNRGDSHLIVYDEDNNVVYELFGASRPGENGDGRWHAASEAVWNLNANTFRTVGEGSADAAGLPILPGLVRPDEALPVSQGGQGVINHAVRLTLSNSLILDQFIYPGEHVANAGNTNAAVEAPMGARFRLKAGVDISQLGPQSKAIAQAMKTYGLILADNGSNFFVTGSDSAVNASGQDTLTWNDADIQDKTYGLKSLTFSDFEVVDLTPRVTGLSAPGGSAGATVTVVGQNFSGAAGNLKVLFGNTAAANVTVVDDSHVTATVPAGSGTVDVRVQSGVTGPSNPNNVENPVFGYGVSAASAADQFTYQTPPADRPPVAANDAATTPAGAPVTVSVLANDSDPDGDPLTLASVAPPAHGTAAVNAGGTVKYTPAAGFSGADQFAYTVNDGRGGSATATVTVTVTAAARSTWTVTTAGPGYAETGPYWHDAYGGGSRYDSSRTGAGAASWTASGLPAGSYQVYVRWAPSPYEATNAPYTVLDGAKPLGAVAVNQEVAPAGFSYGGSNWFPLGTFADASGAITVRLGDGANGAVDAQSILVVGGAASPSAAPALRTAAAAVNPAVAPSGSFAPAGYTSGGSSWFGNGPVAASSALIISVPPVALTPPTTFARPSWA